jgi:hypothetical protein
MGKLSADNFPIMTRLPDQPFQPVRKTGEALAGTLIGSNVNAIALFTLVAPKGANLRGCFSGERLLEVQGRTHLGLDAGSTKKQDAE